MFFFKSERETVWNILFQMKNRFFQLESQTPELKGNRQKRSQIKNVLLFLKSLIIKKNAWRNWRVLCTHAFISVLKPANLYLLPYRNEGGYKHGFYSCNVIWK